MTENLEQLEQLAVEVANQSPGDDLMAMTGAFVESVMLVNNIPADFDGLSLNILRDPDTYQLLAVVITPVDTTDGLPVPRYKVEASQVRKADMPKIVLAS